MSTYDSDDLEATGYFLPEDSQLRLKKLREYVAFLSSLARPRTPDEAQESTAEICTGEVAACLELLEQQIGQVLEELSWPARRGNEAVARGSDAEPAPMQADAEEPEVWEEEGAELEAAEPESAQKWADSTGEPYAFGVTLDQIDEINQLLAMIRAHGDVVFASHEAEFVDGTLSNLGDAIFRDAEKLRDIIMDVYSQELRPAGHRRTGVREEPAAYLALPARLAMGSAAHIVGQHPTYQ